MMAFFCTMPISRMMPISATSDRFTPQIISASSAPTPAEGRLDRMVMRMDVALVEHAQDDVDDDDGRQDQERLALERGLEFRRAAGEGRHHRIRQADFLLRGLDGFDRLAQRAARAAG